MGANYSELKDHQFGTQQCHWTWVNPVGLYVLILVGNVFTTNLFRLFSRKQFTTRKPSNAIPDVPKYKKLI